MNQFATDLYERLAPVAGEDAANGYALRSFVEALAKMFDQVEVFAREAAGVPGWTPLVSPTYAPSDAALRFMAQLAGVRLDVGLNTATMKAWLARAEGRRRGTAADMVEKVQETLTGAKTVFLGERDTSAYHFTLVTRTAETPDAAKTEAALILAKPAGLQYTYATTAGYSWNEATSTWNAETMGWDQTLSQHP